MMLKRISLILLLAGLGACASNTPGGSAAGEGATVCETPRPQVCTADYRPVCANLEDGSVSTFANGCTACGVAEVESWIEGPCPE